MNGAMMAMVVLATDTKEMTVTMEMKILVKGMEQSRAIRKTTGIVMMKTVKEILAKRVVRLMT